MPDDAVAADVAGLYREGVCTSNDQHVLALARVSGARLLYSNDRKLINDFKNPQIVAHPRGKVYTTTKATDVTDTHRKLLAARHLCRAQQG